MCVRERLDRLSQLIPNLCSEISAWIGSAGQSKASQNILLSYVVFFIKLFFSNLEKLPFSFK